MVGPDDPKATMKFVGAKMATCVANLVTFPPGHGQNVAAGEHGDHGGDLHPAHRCGESAFPSW
uniref:Uncharacterized protein n=1 Tax=Calidris pygmaea TaxID=425635 RepID=A0A8C3PLC3_9CHAR